MVTFTRVSEGGTIHPDYVNELQAAIEDLGGDGPRIDLTHPTYGLTVNDQTAGTANLAVLSAGYAAAAAYNASSGGGCTLYAPAGIYYVAPGTASWVGVRSNTTLEGDGAATIFKVIDDAGDYGHIFAAGTAESTITDVVFRDFAVDHNASGNTTGRVAGSASTLTQRTIRLANASSRFTLEGCTITHSGVHSILIAGTTHCEDIRIVGNRFFFQRGSSDAASPYYYDETAVYVAASKVDISHNTFEAAVADHGDTAIQITAGHGSVSDNQIVGHSYGITVTSAAEANDEGPDVGIVVANNEIRQARIGVQLWATTSDYPLKNVVVSGNTIDVQQVTWDVHNSAGVFVTTSSAATGDYENIAIQGNVISFETGDTRTVDQTSIAISTHNYGIGLFGYSGAMTNFVISGNTIRNSPGHGIYLGNATSSPYVGGTLRAIKVHGNQLVDCGLNSAIGNTLRSYLFLNGTLSDVDISGNTIVDTGSGSSNGYYSIFASDPMTATRVFLRWNTILDSGATLTHSILRTKVGDDYNAVNLNFPEIAAGATSTALEVPILGVTTADVVSVSPNGGLENGLAPPFGWVSAAGTVSVALTNVSGTAINPADRSYRVAIHKPGSGRL